MLKEQYLETLNKYNIKLNQFNNCLDDDLIDIIINELNALEKKMAYLSKKLKKEENQ